MMRRDGAEQGGVELGRKGVELNRGRVELSRERDGRARKDLQKYLKKATN